MTKIPKKYRVSLTCCDQITVVVEAEDEKEAKDLAKNEARGNVFGDSFDVDIIEEVK